MESFKEKRQKMVDEEIVARGIKDPRIANAFLTIPREQFVSKSQISFAYCDHPLPIEEKQTISQPYMVAVMIEEANLQPHDKVLEVGTGSGYSAAILSRVVEEVYSIERYPKLMKLAKKRLHKLGITNVHLKVGDGSLGWEECMPYDAIIVTASGPAIPPSLRKQLRIGGRLVMPVGPNLEAQYLIRLTKTGADSYRQENKGAVRFVPLIGKEGWLFS